MAWNYHLLSGFRRDEGMVFDISSTASSFIEAFQSCHPDLTLPELARFYTAIKNVKSLIEDEDSWSQFFSFYQLRYQESLIKILEKVCQCPLSFQNWLSEKQFGARELEVLNAVAVGDINPLLQVWNTKELSKSEGSLALEYAVELFLLGKTWSEILPEQDLKSKAFLQHLKSMRYPETTAKDESRKKGLRALPWPTQIQANWSRQGDQAGIEIRFRVSSLNDFNKKLKGLNQVEEVLGQERSPLQWKN